MPAKTRTIDLRKRECIASIQFAAVDHSSVRSFHSKAETNLLIAIAVQVDELLSHDIRRTVIKHSKDEFRCMIHIDKGVFLNNSNALVVTKRGCSALCWSEGEQTEFARLIAVTFRKRYKGPPVLDRHGIHDTTSGKETYQAPGGQAENITDQTDWWMGPS